MAISRRIGYDIRIIIGDKNPENAHIISKILNEAVFDNIPIEMDLSLRQSIKNTFAKCPAGRPGTADEVANVAELLMSEKGSFITGSTFLIDGGTTVSYYYSKIKLNN